MVNPFYRSLAVLFLTAWPAFRARKVSGSISANFIDNCYKMKMWPVRPVLVFLTALRKPMIISEMNTWYVSFS